MRLYAYLADVVIAVHFAYVAAVLLGLVLIPLGGLLRWRWVRRFWPRVIHLAMIGIVAYQAWLGIECPLTTLEKHLRTLANVDVYPGSFIGHWIDRILFCEAPPWVFVTAYTAVAALTVLLTILIPPERPAGLRLPGRGAGTR